VFFCCPAWLPVPIGNLETESADEIWNSPAAQEIRGSKAEIEDQLGVEIRDFAAPYGWPGRDFSARDVELADEAGYRSFASTFRAPMRAGSSPLCMSRQGLHPAWPLRAVMTRVHE